MPCVASFFYTSSVKNQRFLPPSPLRRRLLFAYRQNSAFWRFGGSLTLWKACRFCNRHAFQPVKKFVFDRLPEVKEAPKTNNSNPSAYIGTVGFELCSKSKCLAPQGFFMPDGIRTGHCPVPTVALINLWYKNSFWRFGGSLTLWNPPCLFRQGGFDWNKIRICRATVRIDN